MIKFIKGNIFDSNAEALVNTVNTVGVMGKGLALIFKEKFPENTFEYHYACKNNLVQTGKMFVTERKEQNPRWIINFPTKQHWRYPSKIEWIIEGLEHLKNFIITNHIKSIAIPPLGAGNGKLSWIDVKNAITSALADLNEVDIQIYEPTKSYVYSRKESTKEASLTLARALILVMIKQYNELDFECSLLEVQKLAWFIERTFKILNLESPLKLESHFKAHLYGPYADNLRHLIDKLEGSYIKSHKRINDSTSKDLVWLNYDKNQEIESFTKKKFPNEYNKAIEMTKNLISGFESPYGMELLATVDWLIHKEGCSPAPDDILIGIQNWKIADGAKRKYAIFKRKDIEIALKQLQENNFIDTNIQGTLSY